MAADIPRCPPENPWCRQELRHQGFVAEMRRICRWTPHVAQKHQAALVVPPSMAALHAMRATPINQLPAAGIEKVFGWIKQWGGPAPVSP